MTRRQQTTLVLVCALAWAAPGCKKKAPRATEAERAPSRSEENLADEAKSEPAPVQAKGMPPSAKKRGLRVLESKGKRRTGRGKDGLGTHPEQGAQTRSWFPETFLFKPLVVTDEQGRAEVLARVPDRLTTWRVLALAHSRTGVQAGSVTRFLGTLPVYVEPVVPPVLRSGDVVRLPINLVNTSQSPVTAALSVSAVGLTLTGGRHTVTLPTRGSAVRYVTLTAGRPTSARLLATLGSADAVVRKITTIPLGRPVTRTRSGTLAAPRELQIQRAAGADPTLGRVRLQVFPGALAILRSELASSGSRGGGLADDAFSLLLAGKAPGLLKALGDPPGKDDAKALRDLAMVSTQRALRHGRVLDTTSATLLAEAALAHPGNPILRRLGKRALDQIAAKQAPDGTCGGETGWSLQRLLVATADCVRAAGSMRRVVVRASGAFERNMGQIKDPYTAAAVLASGAVSGSLALRLRKLVIAALKTRGDGARVMTVPAGVVRADGIRPSEVEATAMAVLALVKEAKAPMADLGAAILAAYSPARGWGDGRASLVCIKAALKLFRDPIPANVTITLKRAGVTVVERALSRKRVREVVLLEAAAGAGAATTQQWSVAARPAVPGLGYALALTDRVPWKKEKRAGVELSVTPPARPVVGQPASLLVRATAPGGRPLKIMLALPAGVQVDQKYLDRLVTRGTLSSYTATSATLQLSAPALPPASIFSADVRVIPTLAGTLHSGASSLGVAGIKLFVPQARWIIK